LSSWKQRPRPLTFEAMAARLSNDPALDMVRGSIAFIDI
jgi:hypothetical protein